MEEKKSINGWTKELKKYLEAVSKHQRQKEDRNVNKNSQRNTSWHQFERNEKLCEPKRKDTDSYLAFDKNCDKFANQLSNLGSYLYDIPGDGNCLFLALGNQLEGQ